MAEAFAEAFAASPVAQAIFEVERRRLVAVNHAFASELGYVVADLESRPIADFIAERDIRAIESRLTVDAARTALATLGASALTAATARASWSFISATASSTLMASRFIDSGKRSSVSRWDRSVISGE